MSDFSFMRKMNDEDAYLFKRCIRKLLDATFLVADRDERLYEVLIFAEFIAFLIDLTAPSPSGQGAVI